MENNKEKQVKENNIEKKSLVTKIDNRVKTKVDHNNNIYRMSPKLKVKVLKITN